MTSSYREKLVQPKKQLFYLFIELKVFMTNFKLF